MEDCNRLVDIIRHYFSNRLACLEITESLGLHRGCSISLSNLKRWLPQENLQERRSPQRDIVNAIAEELGGSGSNIGYRKMHRYHQTKGMICYQEDLRVTVKDLDPEAISLRRRRRLHQPKYISKGPNYTSHVDGYDKLKPFGFSVHDCIDGFSRKLIWLKVVSSYKNPDVIAHYYLDDIPELGGVPHIIKAHDGTKHALIEPLHIYLLSINEEEGIENAFSITTFLQSQRIEAYWSILQRDRLGWWKRFLQDS